LLRCGHPNAPSSPNWEADTIILIPNRVDIDHQSIDDQPRACKMTPDLALVEEKLTQEQWTHSTAKCNGEIFGLKKTSRGVR
jgi:hypothetical protein